MIRIGQRHFAEAWLVDFEFRAPDGEPPTVLCLVAWELVTGCKLRLWVDELTEQPPYGIGMDALFIAYYASAEMACHLSLGWPLPDNVLDLYVEFRRATNGLQHDNSLLAALAWYGLDSIDAAEKDSMRQLAMRGGPWTAAEKAALLNYCETDVEGLAKLLPAMAPRLDLSRALLRGRFMRVAAVIEHNGIPIDTDKLEQLRDGWDAIQDQLIAEIDKDYGVFDGRSFRQARFAQWLAREGIAWPRLDSGGLNLSDDIFKEMARSHPAVAPLRELRVSLSQMRLAMLAVGSDGRNRCLLSPFRARTGRNQPSNSKFIFGTSVWLRGLIKPMAGYGVAYIDWCQQEFGIAAALSKDPLMMDAYQSGDPYLEFAKQAGAVPTNATKQSHAATREQFKQCALAVLYGMAEESLAQRIGQPVIRARHLLRVHREMYRTFWRWSDAAVDTAMLKGELWTVYGWTIHLGPDTNHRSLRNFPMQANGAEMLRLACCMATEKGICVCAPIHDAVLIDAPLEALDTAVMETRAIMAQASAIVLDGFQLRTDVELVRYPDRYMDIRGVKMWDAVWRIIPGVKKR